MLIDYWNRLDSHFHLHRARCRPAFIQWRNHLSELSTRECCLFTFLNQPASLRYFCIDYFSAWINTADRKFEDIVKLGLPSLLTLELHRLRTIPWYVDTGRMTFERAYMSLTPLRREEMLLHCCLECGFSHRSTSRPWRIVLKGNVVYRKCRYCSKLQKIP